MIPRGLHNQERSKIEGWIEKPLGTPQGSFVVNKGIDGKTTKQSDKRRLQHIL